MENVVFLELLRRKLYANLDWEIYYWKDHQGREVDFLIKNGETVKQLIQVTYASEKHEVDQRELKAITTAASEIKCDDMQLITWDYEDILRLNKKTVKCTPLWKWLLTPTKP